MYFEFDDVRRLHQPYTDPMQKMPHWKAPYYNSPSRNWKRGMYAMAPAALFTETAQHIISHAELLGSYYHWPKNRMEYNIFFREVFRLKGFSSELLKKGMFSLVTVAGDTAPKLGMWQYIYGGTWSPQDFVDANSFKHLICALLAVVPTCWTGIPFETARAAYFADKTWPLEL